MGQKDLAAKELESRPEVFADIINALIYQGEQVVSPEQLQPAPTETLYPAPDGDVDKGMHGELHNQYNDVSKYETAQQKIKIQYILENESGENYRLILRKAGYEGAVYRSEYEEKQVYPVVILVLYWGDKKWKPRLSLHEFFAGNPVLPRVKEYVDDIRLHVFSMAHLPVQVRQRFHSDMRIVVDYLAERDRYIPTAQPIRYIGPVMRLLYALTGEEKLSGLLAEQQSEQEKGEQVTMVGIMTKYAEMGRQEGLQQGLREGARAFVMACISKGDAVEDIQNMIQKWFHFSGEEASELYSECIMQGQVI